jgi:hypothetical protein
VAIHVRDTEGRVVCTAEVNVEARNFRSSHGAR